ncbi:hypothetical protein KCU73_g155, partial [Aureobasidium melanogenum]
LVQGYRKRRFWNRKEMLVLPSTVSRSMGQMSAEPAFSAGRTLIRPALRTSEARVVVKRERMLMFQKVQSQKRDWMVTMLPDQTKIEGKEDRPDDQEGPDIGVQCQRQRVVERGELDLGIIHERRPRGRHGPKKFGELAGHKSKQPSEQ